MTPVLDILGFAFVGLAVLWPLSFFGYRFYRGLVEAEEARHAAEGKH
jgi:hypothetical protein